MKTLNAGDVFIGRTYAEMINDALGTNFKSLQRSSVELSDFGAAGFIAWFVYMDGSIHGFEGGWRCSNILSSRMGKIEEHNVSADKSILLAKRRENGYFPFRLCFEIDSSGTKNKYWCRFLGAFRLHKFLCKDLTSVQYLKVSDKFTIASKGDRYSSIINTKDDFMKDKSIYDIPISDMGFSDKVFRFLNNGGIMNLGDLLELGVCIKGEIDIEIREKLAKFMY